ncbi:hypothetical protein AX774_g6895 [Zancudomyces culisetae]|uniref:Uncharacterized protein n=1 Tax=Zancudomyces culisetae TaxID=1213189 RepID=A0A1R1PFA2_ZANCU|nr:hypothetical protein AX774_g6895 [Zancudomyces culisetae]|eukprot:OMH79680.1 hypothetical protein AX774_g6895 [Zancudomyces culisetae]
MYVNPQYNTENITIITNIRFPSPNLSFLCFLSPLIAVRVKSVITIVNDSIIPLTPIIVSFPPPLPPLFINSCNTLGIYNGIYIMANIPNII